ncbi:MFS transporter [Marinagarivorans algicola]|uniref:MFS transporter n=1 Tax=Marinagarivorans algicola TaxID=1513270 RepID=UPI0006B8ACD9|nr:MFS transporter [Marinagarivorans algicola]
MKTFIKDSKIYFNKRILSIFLLGIVSGLPWVMIGSALTLWLKEAGLSRSQIGFAGLIFAVYAVNFLWAPLIDRFSPKSLFKVFRPHIDTRGDKKSWIITCQAIIALCCLSCSLYSPSDAAETIIALALLLAVASATQDIAIDGYRVQSFASHQAQYISAGAAAATGGWWTGYAAIGFLPLWLSDVGWSWASLYLMLGSLSALMCLMCFFIPTHHLALSKQHVVRCNTTSPPPNNALLNNSPLNTYPKCQSQYKQIQLLIFMCLPWLTALWAINPLGLPVTVAQSQWFIPSIITFELVVFGSILYTLGQLPTSHEPPNTSLEKILANIYQTLILPLRNFFMNNGTRIAIGLLSFIFLFKIGEAFLGRMSILFYKEIGFSTTQIATYSKMLTWVVTMIAVIPCGILNARFGLLKGLMISGLCMAASNLIFCLLAIVGPIEWLYASAVIIDGFTAAWATVAFMAFISHLCDHRFSSTQYALLASLGSLGRTLLSSNSGLLVDLLNGNWALFFAITALMVTPSLMLLWQLKDKIHALRPPRST